MRLKCYFAIVGLIMAVLYGSSYQQYRHFDLTDPRGINDAVSYVEMAKGNYHVYEVHRFRFVIPWLVSQFSKIYGGEKEEVIRLYFFAINFLITVASTLVFYFFLLSMEFNWYLSIIGVCFYLTSRITVINTATPLVDSLYFFALILILHLILTNRHMWFIFLMPLLIFSKETICPFLLLPLFCPVFRTRRNLKVYFPTLGLSFCLLIFVRRVIEKSVLSSKDPFGDIILSHSKMIFSNIQLLFTAKGLHDMQNGFSFLIIFAFIGFFINRKYRIIKVPLFLWLVLPISISYMILSGNFGRMFFSSFVIVIPFALLFVQNAFGASENAEAQL